MNRRFFAKIGFVGMVLGIGLPVTAQQPEKPETAPKEAARLRVENVQFGRVELSVDAGKTYHLVGRVLTPAVTVYPTKDAKTPGTVMKATKEGVIFVAAPGMTLKLRPQPTIAATRAASTTEPGAIITNLKAGDSVFGEWLPIQGSAAYLQNRANSLSAFPSVFAPSDSDVFVFVAKMKEGETDNMERGKKIEMLSKAYRDKAMERAKTEKRTIVNGTLTLRAKLPTNEPDPITAVTYLIEGELASIQNAPPYVYAWDTRHLPDGEYAVEIRGMNKQGNLVTKIRALVAVDNGKR